MGRQDYLVLSTFNTLLGRLRRHVAAVLRKVHVSDPGAGRGALEGAFRSLNAQ